MPLHSEALADDTANSVVSPDGNIHARVTGRTNAQVTFKPHTFHRYDEPRLGQQLARLGALAWVAITRQRNDSHHDQQQFVTRDEAAFDQLTEHFPADSRERRYRAELREIEGIGRSANGAVRLRTRGMARWTVEIDDGALRHLGEQRFLDELHTALGSMLADRDMKIILLKGRHFDLGLPAQWRAFARDPHATRRP